MEIGAEAALFPEKEYINGNFIAVHIAKNGSAPMAVALLQSTGTRNQQSSAAGGRDSRYVKTLKNIKNSKLNGKQISSLILWLLLLFRNQIYSGL